jgi:tetratricopeptide (TPR) repeat protein
LEVIRIQPDSPAGYFELGRVYDRIGRFDDAREAFRQAIRLNVDTTGTPLQRLQLTAQPWWGCHFLIAQFYYRHDEYREAIEVLKQAASIYPDSDDVHAFLSTTYLALGDKFSALNEYNSLKDKTTEFARNILAQIEKK